MPVRPIADIDATDAWNLDGKLERAGCPSLSAENQSVANLSGGERRLKSLLLSFVTSETRYLLLDEPTNHLDAESIDWLEQHLQPYEGTVLRNARRYSLDP